MFADTAGLNSAEHHLSRVYHGLDPWALTHGNLWASPLAPAFSKRLDMLSSPISKDPCSGVRKYLVAKPHRGHTSPGRARSELARTEGAVFLFSSLLSFCVLQLYSERELKYTKVLNYPAEISPVIAVEFIHTRLYESTKCISATL